MGLDVELKCFGHQAEFWAYKVSRGARAWDLEDSSSRSHHC